MRGRQPGSGGRLDYKALVLQTLMLLLLLFQRCTIIVQMSFGLAWWTTGPILD